MMDRGEIRIVLECVGTVVVGKREGVGGGYGRRPVS